MNSNTVIDVDTALSIRDYDTAKGNKTVCLIIDVLRASSTIVSMLENGCRRVYTVAVEEQARKMGLERNMITSGEWQGIKLSGFDMDNSPAEAGRFPLRDRDVALCTSNGTRVIDKAKNCVHLFIASLLNARSCAKAALLTAQASSCGITVVCAGQYGKFVLDDAYCAGYLLQELETNAVNMGIELKYSDASKAARALLGAYPDARTAFMESSSGKVMIKTNSYEDFEVCLKTNCSEVVPYLQMENDLIWFGKWEEQTLKEGKV